ncbi:UNVERIFIED_CONTAM: hypothetical protein NCL1_47301 [Trichonephila clavipes]
MAAPIQNPAKCEGRSLTRFLHAKGQRPADIHKEVVSVNGNIMNRQNVTKWCRHFYEGRTDVYDEQRTGRPSVISDALLQRTEEGIHDIIENKQIVDKIDDGDDSFKNKQPLPIKRSLSHLGETYSTYPVSNLIRKI